MYDKKLKKWVSDCNTPELQQMCRNPENAEDPEVQFIKASDLLSKTESKENMIQAVAKVEILAKRDYMPAVFAMGQMRFYGWGVSKDRKKAIELYKRAADAGYEPAKQALSDLKREKRIRFFAIVLPICVAAAVTACMLVLLIQGGMQIIKVNEETQLSKVTTADEFSKEISSLIAEYDDEMVISGQASSNRIILKFEGNVLDLSEFLADRVIARGNNIVVIQFSDEAEAQRCLEKLKNEKNIMFVETDEYTVTQSYISEEYCTLTPVKSTDATSDYYSWGVADMGLDKLSEYVDNKYSSNNILVAVIDSGALVHSENAHRYLEGYNVVTGGKVYPADHGTHVTGIVLDGANCDNVYVKNYDVFNGEDSTSKLLICTAIEMAVYENADVINMSLGGPCTGVTEEFVNSAVAAGVTVVCAAGNESSDTATGISCPADITEAIVVGAYDVNHDIASFSNYGYSVDVCAPGVEVWSYSHEADGKLANLQGTSMASPHVAAMAALLKTIYTDATPVDIENYIKNSCRTFRNSSAYATGAFGAGAPDATVFIESY